MVDICTACSDLAGVVYNKFSNMTTQRLVRNDGSAIVIRPSSVFQSIGKKHYSIEWALAEAGIRLDWRSGMVCQVLVNVDFDIPNQTGPIYP